MDALAALEGCLEVDPSSADWSGRVAPYVDRLSTTLRTHFDLEERGEFYRDLPASKPRLAGKILACREQHETLLEGVTRLAADIDGGGDEAERRRLAARAALLAHDVRRHEAAEAELMQSAALREVGSGD